MSLIQGFQYSLIDINNNPIGASGQPNENFGRLSPRFVVLHSTGGPNFNTNLDLLTSKKLPPKSNTYVCAHYLIGNKDKENGLIFQLLDERLKGVHANNLNDLSIGIELVDKFYNSLPNYEPFINDNRVGEWLTPEEYLSCLILCTDLSIRLGIPRKYISLYEIKNNTNIVSPNPIFNVNDRTVSGNGSNAIEKLKKSNLSGFIFHKDFISTKSDPVFFNGEKFINDLNKTFIVTGIGSAPQNYLNIFNGIINGNITVDQIGGNQTFELLPNVNIKETFRKVISILKNSKKEREEFEKTLKVTNTLTKQQQKKVYPGSSINDGSI